MVRNAMSNRFLRDRKRIQREQEQREHIQHLQVRWRNFAFPVQEELTLHLRHFELEAAQHATAIAERLHASPVDSRRPAKSP